MRINILYPIRITPWGGANQFLAALKGYFCKVGVYSKLPKDAEIILFNLNPSSSFPTLLLEIKQLQKLFPKKLIVTRIDGPVSLTIKNQYKLDKTFYTFVHHFSDGNIFQSNWSRQQNYKTGLKQILYETVINNAPNPNTFNRKGKIPFSTQRKTEIIASSWSSNWKKGFSVYQWMDEHIDFNRFNMKFVGNSPITFNKTVHIQALPTEQLAAELKKNDIYITASLNETCSNSLIEALSCGLPAIAKDDSGHPEIIKDAGELFNEPEEIPATLDKIVNNYTHYQKNICVRTIDEVGQQYINFIENIYNDFKLKKYVPKTFNYFRFYSIYSKAMIWKIKSKLYSLIK